MGPSQSTQTKQTETALMGIVNALVDELHPGVHQGALTHLDSRLDYDLGLDSLSRVELINRVESHFSVVLPELTYAQAETIRDILQDILTAPAYQNDYFSQLEIVAQPHLESQPHSAETLVDVLIWHVRHHPERKHLYLLEEKKTDQILSYQNLYEGAVKVACGLRQRGLDQSESVAIMLPTSLDYFYCFFGVLIAGGVPVPIYPPIRLAQLEDHLLRHSRILNNCKAKLMVTIPDAKLVAHLLKVRAPDMKAICSADELLASPPILNPPKLKGSDIAFIQYTSGSTGEPKGVVLTHHNLLANIRAMGSAAEVGSDDVFVSWLPLYHDMGLIGAWLGSLYFAMLFIVMSPLSFLTRPERWLWALHRFQGTLSASPNFGYELCLKRLSDQALDGLELSSWRGAFNGAEAIAPRTLKAFCEHFSRYGFSIQSMKPVYGLAENAVGLAFPKMDTEPRIDYVDRELFSRSGQAKPTNSSHALEFISCGFPIPDCQIRIVDKDQRELPERRQGELEFYSPSSTSGYLNAIKQTEKLYDGAWLRSGDLGYIANGELFITGRIKDVVIRGGRNIYPHELEQAIGELQAIRTGRVVAFGCLDQAKATEKLVVIAETREQLAQRQAELRTQMNTLSLDLIGMPIDQIVLSPPGTILKTSSGKVRRAACKQLYLQGILKPKYQTVPWQLLRLGLSSFSPWYRSLLQGFRDRLYAGYAWLSFSALASVTLLGILLLPAFSWRWKLMKYSAKLLTKLNQIPVTVRGREHSRMTGPCVYAVNHASYLDSLVMAAILPGRYRFIAKAEFKTSLVLNLALKRLHAEYVERHDRQQSALESQHLVELLQSGEKVVIFPEGTFRRAPGLNSFHLGAFLAATEAQVPVIPIAIQGTRSILRAGSWFPRHGDVSVTIGAPLTPRSVNVKEKTEIWSAALKLKEETFLSILQHCGEPDTSADQLKR